MTNRSNAQKIKSRAHGLNVTSSWQRPTRWLVVVSSQDPRIQFQSRLQATTRSYPVTCMDSSDGECEVAVPAPRKSESLKALHESWKLGTAPAKTSWANDTKHATRCTRTNCVRCSYVNRSSELAKLSPMFTSDMLAKLTFSPDQVQLARSCWLASAIVDDEWGLGCIVCCATNSSAGVFASFSWRGSGTAKKLRKAKILKHGASAEHKRALAKYFNLSLIHI